LMKIVPPAELCPPIPAAFQPPVAVKLPVLWSLIVSVAFVVRMPAFQSPVRVFVPTSVSVTSLPLLRKIAAWLLPGVVMFTLSSVMFTLVALCATAMRVFAGAVPVMVISAPWLMV
jgi:hypothetical protein